MSAAHQIGSRLFRFQSLLYGRGFCHRKATLTPSPWYVEISETGLVTGNRTELRSKSRQAPLSRFTLPVYDATALNTLFDSLLVI